MEKKKSKCSVEVWSRPVGFYRPVQDWNPGKGKSGEFGERKPYEIGTKVKSKINEKNT